MVRLVRGRKHVALLQGHARAICGDVRRERYKLRGGPAPNRRPARARASLPMRCGSARWRHSRRSAGCATKAGGGSSAGPPCSPRPERRRTMIRRSKPLPAAIWQLARCPLPRRRRWKISLSDHPHRAAARLPRTLTLRGRMASCAPSADNSRLFPVRSSDSCIAKKHHVAAREHPDFCANGRSRRHVGGRAAAPAFPSRRKPPAPAARGPSRGPLAQPEPAACNSPIRVTLSTRPVRTCCAPSKRPRASPSRRAASLRETSG